MARKKTSNLLIILSLTLLYLIFLLLYKFGIIDFLIPCLVKLCFGVECLACGTNRAFLALLSGEIHLSWQINPLAILVSIAFLIYLFSQIKRILHEN